MNLNLRQITAKLSPRGWIAVGAAALIGVAFIFILMTVASAPSYTTLVAGESPAQAQKVTSALGTAGIPYQLSPGGTAVSVPSAQAGQARDLLASAGLSVGGSSSLESLLGKSSLGESNFQQDEQAQSAEEQQLDQTIEQMNGVTGAVVSLAIPDQANELFTGVTTPTTASVLLNTSATLQPATIKAIAETVANAIPGLNVNKVSITDQYGDQLWPSSGPGGGVSSGLTAKQSAQDAYNDQQAEAVDAALASTLGPNKAMVLINADLNMNRQTVDSVTYGKRTIPLSSTATKEKLNGTATPNGQGTNATKIPTLAGNANNPASKYSNNTLTTTNGVNKTVSQAVIAPGQIDRQTISVLVNNSVPASLDPTIESLVKGAVGFKPGRDRITVGTLPFQRVKPVAAASSSSQLGDVKYVAVVLGSLLFLGLITRSLRKRERQELPGDPAWMRELERPRPLSELEAQAALADLEPPTAVARLRPPVNPARQQIEELVDRDPERVASQIRQWMTED